MKPISTPSQGCFLGQSESQNTTQVNYTFKPSGVVYWSNSLGSNMTISSVSVTVAGISITIPIASALMNGTTFAYPLTTPNLSATLYFSQLTNGCGGQSNQYSIKITGTMNAIGSLALNMGNPNQLPTKCDQNNLEFFIGTEGIDFRDAIAYAPICNGLSITFTLPAAPFTIDPATIGTSNSNGNCGGTGCDNQLRMWEASGYYWAFYTDNSHFGYRSCFISSGNCDTSSTNWGAFTNINGEAGIGFCSTYINATIDSTYLYYACGSGSNAFVFNAGHLTSGGVYVISRPTISVTTNSGQSGYAFVLAVTNASVWVAVKTYDGTNEHIEVWSDNFAGVQLFVNKLDQNDMFGNNDAHPSLDAVRTGGSTYIEVTWGYDGYGINFPLKIRATTNYGSTWSSAVSTACNIDAMGFSEVANSNGTEYIVATQAGGSGCTQGKLDYIRWDYGSASITYETKNFLTTCSNNCDGNTIATDGGANYAITYESSTSSIAYKLSSDHGDTYGSPVTVSSSETLSSLDFTLSNSYFCTSNNEILGWMSGGGTPFDVRFALFACSSSAAFSATLTYSLTFSPTINSITLVQTVTNSLSFSPTATGSPASSISYALEFIPSIPTIGLGILISYGLTFFPIAIGCVNCGSGNSTTTITTTTTSTAGQIIGGNELDQVVLPVAVFLIILGVAGGGLVAKRRRDTSTTEIQTT